MSVFAGRKWFYGAGAPASDFGNNGDVYLNTTAGTWYYRSAGAWAIFYTGAAGTVTSVTGAAPITSTGGATPEIGITAATTGAAGSMSAADKLRIDRMKAGTVLKASFAGTPKVYAVTFGTAYPDTNYAIALSCLVTTSGSAYTPVIYAKATTGFSISMTVNNVTNLTSVDWKTEYHYNT